MKRNRAPAVPVPARQPQEVLPELHPARILELLTTSRLGRIVALYDDVGSTNAVARAAAADGVPEGLLVIAEEQRSGRGRKGRIWFSARGKSLTCSLVLRPARTDEGLTAILALAVVEALGEFAGGCGIKWPNDIFCEGKKLGGILAESQRTFVVLGLGLNINEAAGDFDDSIRGDAVSLSVAAGRRFDRGIVLCRILEEFEPMYIRFQEGGFAPFRAAVQHRLLYIGKRVAVDCGGRSFEGNMAGITDAGYVRLDIDGVERVFSSGDLTLRKKPPRP